MTGTAAFLLAVVVGVVGLAAWLIPSNDELALMLGQAVEKRTGIALKVGQVRWSLRPLPKIELGNLSTAQEQPIVVRRVVISPQLWPLLSRRIRIDTLEVAGALLPRESVRAFRGIAPAPDAGAWTLDAIPLGHVMFNDVTWSDRRSIELSYDGDIVFDAGWRPRTADVSRHDQTPPARLRLTREGDAEQWRVLIDAGGGTGNGTASLQTLESGRVRLKAQLQPDAVDIGLFMQAFKRSAPIAGKVYGTTDIDAEAAQVPGLWTVLHTRTSFSVRPATLTRFDLARAVKTAGVSRGGTTPLDELSGTLDTQNTDDGTRMTYTGLKARSGLLTATGKATIFNRRLSGEAAVDIVDGVVGMPLKLGGTLDNPELSLTGAALTGAAVGTAVAPGVGTALGARIGQQLERFFGDKEGARRAAPKRPRP